MSAMRDAIMARHGSGPANSRVRSTQFAFLACTITLLAGCGPRITNANLEVVNSEFEKSEHMTERGLRDTGVSPKEAEAILGQPQRIETYRLPLETQKKELDGVRYYYQQDGNEIVLHFLDNKLISRAPLLSEKLAPALDKSKP